MSHVLLRSQCREVLPVDSQVLPNRDITKRYEDIRVEQYRALPWLKRLLAVDEMKYRV